MTATEKTAKRNQYWDAATEFARMATCYERGSSDWKRFMAEAGRMERIAKMFDD